jgi:class 3 adenylate cyclase/tRNA A-37 threonylcarbamoyl transferase component Bud32
MVGETIGNYKILEKLGRGRTSMVYKAEDLHLGRTVVLKFLPSNLLQDEVARARFTREAKAASALDHPNICTFYGIQQGDSGQLFIAMAFYEGESIKDKIKRGPLPYEMVRDYVTQICQGLARVHQKGIVHRNIKPGNLLVTTDGVVKISDFGHAKLQEGALALTRVGTPLGSPAYMSPEQVSGGKVDHRTDLWSLGVVTFEMITGRRPFEAPYGESLIYLITQSDAPLMSTVREDVSPKWEQIVRKALHRNVFERYQRAEEMLAAVQSITSPVGFSPYVAAAAPERAERAVSRSAAPGQPKLEMAYVLFTDLVAYSTLTMDQQAHLIGELTRFVEGTEQFKLSKAHEQLILLPTGDGMALVFFDDPIAPVQCAVQLSQKLRGHLELKLRMGIHSGPVYRTVDINKAGNVAGGGINLAQRVMDCGNEGHILVSKTVADTLNELRQWRSYVHDLGEAEVKHGVKVHVYNLCSSEFGNPELPRKLRSQSPPPPAKRTIGSLPPARLGAVTAGGMALALLVTDALVWKSATVAIGGVVVAIAAAVAFRFLSGSGAAKTL